MYGRHFDENDEVVSLVTRASIDVLKVRLYSQISFRLTLPQTVFRDEVAKEDWQLLVKLKSMLDVM